jgi:hypothetical protein
LSVSSQIVDNPNIVVIRLTNEGSRFIGERGIFWFACDSTMKARQSPFRYNPLVRRLISITLLLLFSLPLISPVLALAAVSDANLPACCRRNGAHHCMMKTQQTEASGHGPSFSAIPQKCPAYPAMVTSVRHGDLSLSTACLIFAEIVSHPSVKAQTIARSRVALDRSRQKRGPPTNLL